jgi:hypothetical protein
MDRAEILATALEYISKDRAATHGKAENSFQTIGGMWTVYLEARDPGPLTPHDVSAMMVLFKMARVAGNPTHMDNWIDSAGYSGLGGELASKTDHVKLIEEKPDE